MPITSDKPEISCAALGDNTKGTYVVHIVNNGTACKVTLTGLPAGVKQLNVYITSKTLNMKGHLLQVKNGGLNFKLPATCYATFISQ